MRVGLELGEIVVFIIVRLRVHDCQIHVAFYENSRSPRVLALAHPGRSGEAVWRRNNWTVVENNGAICDFWR